MNKKIYFDCFLKVYVDEKDPYAAPERYFELLLNSDSNEYIESWLCEGGHILNVSYTRSDLETGKVPIIRLKATDQAKRKVEYIISWTVPEDIYNEIINYVK